MRFTRCNIRPTRLERTARRMANMQKAVQREAEDIPLFPELRRFATAEERFTQIDNANMAHFQRLRDDEAANWRWVRKQLRAIPADKKAEFLAFWNGHTMFPAAGYYCADVLHGFLKSNGLERVPGSPADGLIRREAATCAG